MMGEAKVKLKQQQTDGQSQYLSSINDKSLSKHLKFIMFVRSM